LGSESEYKTPEPAETVVQEHRKAPIASQNRMRVMVILGSERSTYN
jgi:hypothetical protein